MVDKKTDFEIELARIDSRLDELDGVAFDSSKISTLAYLQYQRASLTGNLESLSVAEATLDRAIQQLGPSGDLYYLKANIHFKVHRLDEVEKDLQLGRDLAQSIPGRTLQADLDFQLGRYQTAQTAYEAIIDEERTWDALARLAYLHFKMGDIESADRLYDEAVDELTAKEMRHYSWIELQRGVVDLSRGKYDLAGQHYDRAKRAYSGHWLVDEHLAELAGATGNFGEAEKLYRDVVARVPRPDFQQALGELYLAMGDATSANEWFDQARQGFLESADRGEVHYYHHLADFCADVDKNGPEAVRWARKDLELRRNFSTLAALAWALYRAGELAEATELMDEALSSGAKDAHLFRAAGLIYKAASANGKGAEYLQAAKELHPTLRNFHVHR
jgi:tetratricopeptide (TPR) repeat protein